VTPTRPWRPPILARDAQVTSISAREADVLTGLCLGLTSAAIGHRLDISEAGVKSRLKKLYAALGARDRAHAVALATTGQVTIHVKESQP
jgi:DNA-binding NarL/FixJ family response regulator